MRFFWHSTHGTHQNFWHATPTHVWCENIHTVLCSRIRKTFWHPLNTALQHTATARIRFLTSYARHTATHCNTLQHTATHCNTLHHTATEGIRLSVVLRTPTHHTHTNTSYSRTHQHILHTPTHQTHNNTHTSTSDFLPSYAHLCWWLTTAHPTYVIQ